LPGSSRFPLSDLPHPAAADPAIRPSILPDEAIRPSSLPDKASLSSRRPAVSPEGRVKILVADDNRLSRESLEKSIQCWGYDVETVRDGGAAFTALLKPDAPRLALLDWEMPGLSGIDVCRLLRARGDGPYVYVLLCTGKEKQRHLIDGLAAGADDYIRKPIDRQELEVRLRAGRRIVLLQDQLLDAQTELEHRAMYDSLTGIKNRGAILDMLERDLSRAGRTGKPVSLAIADLDFFKRVNDNHGHPAGDTVLKEFARRAASAIRAHDEIGRYGGEEFLVVFAECGSEEARIACERIRDEMAKAPVETTSSRVLVTASVGVASTDQGYSTAIALIGAADRALYVAKAGGRNRTVVAPRVEGGETKRPTS
jgi:two-component system cell cycle response regulator